MTPMNPPKRKRKTVPPAVISPHRDFLLSEYPLHVAPRCYRDNAHGQPRPKSSRHDPRSGVSTPYSLTRLSEPSWFLPETKVSPSTTRFTG